MIQEEKFKEAKKLYESANADQKYVLESLFPDLKESEDERIRKEIVRFIRMEVEDEIVGNKWIAWLKKQDNQKSIWHNEDEKNCQGILDEIEANKSEAPEYDIDTYNRFVNWLKSIRHKNLWKPSDEQMDVLLSEVNAWVKGCSKQKVLESLYNDLKKLKS